MKEYVSPINMNIIMKRRVSPIIMNFNELFTTVCTINYYEFKCTVSYEYHYMTQYDVVSGWVET